jgi:hypothetical protein
VAELTHPSILDRADELRAVSGELRRCAEESSRDLLVQLAAMQRLVAESQRLRRESKRVSVGRRREGAPG